jgi:tetratricopeptide (TPR) repeat protein
VSELFNILKKDHTRLQYTTESGPIDYFPTKKFRINVDPDIALKTGTVSPEEVNRVTDLEWTINRSGLTKAYLMMLDLLAHNNWERPVYYVATTGSEAYLGLEDYFRQEGLAYRLVPIKSGKGSDGQPRAVNTAVMFDNLMNKFEFNVTSPGIYINEDNFRMATTFRNAYMRLARALMNENKMDSAVRVCDRISEMIPDRVVPLGYFNIGIGEVYLAAQEKDKGKEIFDRLVAIQEEQLDYYFSFPDHLRPAVRFDMEQCLAILHAVIRIVGDLGEKELENTYQEKMDFYYDLYLGNINNP